MDLGAFVNIKNLQRLAEANGIDIPRLRGYRLMQDETEVDEEDISDIIHNLEIWECKNLFGDKYIQDINENDKRIRWELLHGKRRKVLKFAVKKRRKRAIEQYRIFNKYVGQSGVLYIHARIGGSNWNSYGGSDLEKNSWFIEKVDDCFDGTYCDIYAKITACNE